MSHVICSRRFSLRQARLSALTALLVSGCAGGLVASGSPVRTADLEVNARIGVLQGACNSVRCPDIQYQVAVTKLHSRRGFPLSTDADLAVLSICGESGLLLGGHYKFLLRKRPVPVNALDRPTDLHGNFLECKLWFNLDETVATPYEA